MFMNVDFPEPEGPMMAAKRAVSNATVTPSSARTSVERWPYTFVASTVAAAAEAGGSFSEAESSIVAIGDPLRSCSRRIGTDDVAFACSKPGPEDPDSNLEEIDDTMPDGK